MSTSRQLAAILFADIQGYTALMQDDEAAAMIVREKFQKSLTNEVRSRSGRIIQLSGDGAFCIFKSAIEAIHAAIEIQKQMMAAPKVPLRIGIHSGDVIMDGDNVYGDGVNVASRIESFAVPGSVFISGKVFDEIKNQKDILAVSLGKFELKNVSEPMEMLAISNEGLMVPKKEILEGKGRKFSEKKPSSRKIITGVAIVIIITIGFFLQNKFQHPQFTGADKSIAVLPFVNISADKDNEYFSDGITEDIITRLSQIAGLKVIARTSVMRFKNTTESIRQIASDLGVSAILEGSVQKSGNQIRITAQLIDAGTDENLWAEKYDRELKDIFQIQSEVSELIAISMNASLTALQKSRVEKKPTENLEAYNLYLQGNYLWNKHSYESLTEAIELYSKAIALDSNFALAYAARTISYASHGWFDAGKDSITTIMRLDAERAISIDPNLAAAHTALGEYYSSQNDLEAAMKEFDKAIELDPNYAHAWTYKGFMYFLNGEFDKALPMVSEALTLDPLAPNRMADKARILALLGQKQEAQQLIEKAETLEPGLNTLPDTKPFVFFCAGNYDSWIKMMAGFDSAGKINHYYYLGAEAIYFAIKGDKNKSAVFLDSCVQQNSAFSNWHLKADVQYWSNEKENALAMLRNGCAQVPASQMAFALEDICTDYYLSPLKNDPSFREIIKKIGWMPL